MTPYFQRDGVVLYHGDCREILPTIEAGSVDLVLTDPPYGINHSSSHGASWQDTEIANDSDTSCRDCVINWADMNRLPWVSFGTWKSPAPKSTRGCLVWDKGPAFGMGDLNFPWKPSWEQIYVGGDGWEGRRDEGVLRGPVVISWESRGRCHPHQKPEWLMKHFIGKLPGFNAILDPFAGSGTTLRAAMDLGRKAIGIEISEKYCEIAAKRLEQRNLQFAEAM
jgi:site-specific DNA-methyltransferase (adenine-specific)